ncbi:MAG: nucleoside triphosphate pyrophosphohydrolase [Bacilli bacterium]|nr:nucleoside triphosphate pyrophosphohydrolase [Bacilli bacterium]
MMKYNKLVRDKIPEIIESNNEKAITRVLSDEEYRLELEKKLYEEYEEVINSNGDERIEELADMLEVMIALANNEEKDFEDIEKVRVLKKEKRGGFSKRIYLEDVR